MSEKLDRKRLQEKRRRVEFKDSLRTLFKTLLQNDEEFLCEFQKRKDIIPKRSIDGKSKCSLSDENSLFNRIELINQASFTIKRMTEENEKFKKIIDDIKKEGKSSFKQCHANSPSKKKRVNYHHGVGPIEYSEQGCTISPFSTVNKDTTNKTENKRTAQPSLLSREVKKAYSNQHESIASISQDSITEEESNKVHQSMIERTYAELQGPSNSLNIYSNPHISKNHRQQQIIQEILKNNSQMNNALPPLIPSAAYSNTFDQSNSASSFTEFYKSIVQDSLLCSNNTIPPDRNEMKIKNMLRNHQHNTLLSKIVPYSGVTRIPTNTINVLPSPENILSPMSIPQRHFNSNENNNHLMSPERLLNPEIASIFAHAVNDPTFQGNTPEERSKSQERRFL